MVLVYQGHALLSLLASQWLHCKASCPARKQPALGIWVLGHIHSHLQAITYLSLSFAKYQQRVNFFLLPESFAGISTQDGLTAPEIDSSHWQLWQMKTIIFKGCNAIRRTWRAGLYSDALGCDKRPALCLQTVQRGAHAAWTLTPAEMLLLLRQNELYDLQQLPHIGETVNSRATATEQIVYFFGYSSHSALQLKI